MPATCHFAFVCHKPVGERLVHVAFQNIGLSCSIGKLQNQLEGATLLRMHNFQATTNPAENYKLAKSRSFHHQSWSDKCSVAHICSDVAECVEVAVACAPQ